MARTPWGGQMREQILLEHMAVVRFVANRVYARLPRHVEMEDLVSAGVVGLIDAFQKFDVGRQAQFRTYAQIRIRGAILDSLRGMDWGSRELRRKARDMEAAGQRVVHRMGRPPQASEVAEELSISLAEYQEAVQAVKNLEIASLQEMSDEGSGEDALICLEADPEDDSLRCALRS